jgi:tRNA A37 methylthiotransferase MiaB
MKGSMMAKKLTKVGFVSLGCPKNLVDSEVMLGTLAQHGYEITHSKQDADVLVVNTCGFIDSAKQESIDTILEMAELKSRLMPETGGCRMPGRALPQRYPQADTGDRFCLRTR